MILAKSARATSILGLVLAAVLSSSATPVDARAAAEYHTATSPVNLLEIEQEFDSEGTMSVPVRGQTLILTLAEREIHAPGGRTVYEVRDHELVPIGEVKARNFVGRVQGNPTSLVYLTLDRAQGALLATIFDSGLRTSVRTVAPSGADSVLESRWQDRYAQVPAAPADLSGAWKDSVRAVQVSTYADLGFAGFSDWSSRISAAYNRYHDMNYDQTDVDLQINGYIRMGTTLSQTDCSLHRVDFSDWLTGLNRYYNADVHQEFSGVNFAGTCVGNANAAQPFRTAQAASVIEAKDHSSSDTYNPNDMDHLGALSGQETNHVLGEPGHMQDTRCESYVWTLCIRTTYNIMSYPPDAEDYGFWVTSSSAQKVKDHVALQS